MANLCATKVAFFNEHVAMQLSEAIVREARTYMKAIDVLTHQQL